MTTLARLSFWVPPERMDDFAATYRKELVPLLQHHALRESSVEGRPTAAGVFSRLFEMERPADVALKAQALAHDAAWQAALQGIKDRYAPTAARETTFPIVWTCMRRRPDPAKPGSWVRGTVRDYGRALGSWTDCRRRLLPCCRIATAICGSGRGTE
jgi:hypothetical protein